MKIARCGAIDRFGGALIKRPGYRQAMFLLVPLEGLSSGRSEELPVNLGRRDLEPAHSQFLVERLDLSTVHSDG